MKHCLLWLHALTPLHNGAGQGLGSIDRPVIREPATEYPYVQSSTLKGAVRERAIESMMHEQRSDGKVVRPPRARDEIERNDDTFLAAFGVGESNGNQGCLAFTDAQLLLLPVRSLTGTFAWATSALPLARLLRWLEIGGDVIAGGESGTATLRALLAAQLPVDRGIATGCHENDKTIRVDMAAQTASYCVEGLVLASNSGLRIASERLAKLAKWLGTTLFPRTEDQSWRNCLAERLLLLADDDFTHLVRHALQVEANIRIGPTGVTETGSLRYTEYLPAETVLLSFVTVQKPFRKRGPRRQNDGALADAPILEADVAKLATALFAFSPALQIGADESKGKGIARTILSMTGAAGQE